MSNLSLGGRREVTNPYVKKLLEWDAPRGMAVTSMDFVREVGHDRLAVADQGGGLHLITVDDQHEVELPYHMVAYSLASVPRRTHPPGLAAVGQQILVFDSDGKRLFDTALPGGTTALAVTALVVNELTVIAVGGKDRDADVYLYAGNTGQLQLLRHLQVKGNGAVRAIEALHLERYLVVAHDGGISTWDISRCADQEPRLLRSFGRGDTRAMTVFYDPQGRPRLATASTHGIQIWDPGAEGSEHPLGWFARGINATAIAAVATEHPDPQLAVADGDSVSLWSTTTEKREGEPLKEHKDQVRCLAASPTEAGSTLVGAADDHGRVVVWQLPGVQSTTRPYGTHDRWVNVLVAVPAREWLRFASASDDGTVRVWQPEPGPTGRILQPSSGAAVQGLAVVQETGDKPERLICGDEAGYLTSWKMPEGELDVEMNIGTAVRALATIHDQAGREYVVAAGAGAGLTVQDINACSNGRPIQFDYPQSAEPTLVRALAVGETDNDGELLAAGDSHGRVTVWRTVDRRQLWTNADQHRGQVRTLAWVPTAAGLRLASGGSDGNIYLWPPDGRNPQRFNGHGGPVATLAALSTAKQRVPTSKGEVHLFASGGADGTIRTWNPDAPDDPSQVLRAHPGWVRALLRLEHGGTLHVISGGDDGTARQARGGPARDPRQSSPDQVLPSRILPVWFNPWAHKSAEEVWAGLTQEIIRAAKPVLGETDAEWQRYWFTRNLERLDRAEVRRMLRRRVFWQPLLSSPLLAPVIAAAVAIGLKWPATLSYFAAACGVVALIAMTVRWWCGLARAYLPADIMEGPVLSGFQANPGPFAPASSADDRLLHDPMYRARSGYLYLVQHDVKALVGELARRGYMLVVFIDDLDRCPPETVAEVFEAVNIFLAEEFAHAKFVIGLDPSVVAHDLAEVFRGKESRLRDDPDDPNLGWSFLRKLCQLPLTLPEIREAHTARLMRRHTPSGGQRSDPSTSQPSSNPAITTTSGSEAGTKRRRRWGHDGAPPEVAQSANGQPAAGDNRDADTLLFEADPVIRDHLRALMRLRPHQSVRETKRLLTLWAFYLRLLPRLLPQDATSSAQFGRDVLTLAEVLTRWPALVPKLGSASSPESGLRELIEAAKTNADPAQVSPWHETLRRLGLDGDKYHASCESLRELLNLYGNEEVAYYAECVL